MLLSQLIERENNAFGVVRLVAACVVVFDHMFMLTAGNRLGWPFAGTSSTLGQLAVYVFFVLSGILVASSLDRSKSVLHYAVSRSLRIIPGLVVCVLATVLIVGPVFTTLPLGQYLTSRETLDYLMRTLSLSTGMAPLPGVFADHPLPGRINVPIWTIKYEVLCYIALGLFAWLGLWRQHRLRHLAGLSLLGAMAAVILLPGLIIPEDKLVWFINLTLAFLFGIMAYTLRHHLRINGLGCMVLAAGFIAALGTPLERLLAPAFVGYLALLLAQLPFGPLKDFTDEVDLSYGVYIYGWIVSQTVIAMSPGIAPQTALLFVFPMVLAIATLSWFLVEKPGLDLRTRLYRWLDGRLLQPVRAPRPRLVRAGSRVLAIETGLRDGRVCPSVRSTATDPALALRAVPSARPFRRNGRLR